MKFCPACERKYDDEMRVCGVDGTPLKSLTERDAPQDPVIGQIIKGRYRVLRKLGEGGMGTVYLAEQVSIGRKVAVKLLRGNYACDEEFIARFQREARLAASLNHRNIITVYDFDQADDGSLFIAMEYVNGEQLSEVIQREGPLPIGRATRLGLQIAEGLEAAHRAGVIHRDIKPDNIMVVRDSGFERIIVMDFGVARLREAGTGTQLTRAGTIMGTPAYMAPEQAEGSGVSDKTDLYALGIVLYEMLSGSVPFKGSTPSAVLAKQLRERPVELRKLRAEVPAAIERVVMRALEKKPEKRQGSMHEVVQELQKAGKVLIKEDSPKALVETLVLKEGAIDATGVLQNRHRWAGMISVLAVSGIVLTTYWFSGPAHKEEVSGPPEVTVPVIEQPKVPAAPAGSLVTTTGLPETPKPDETSAGHARIQIHVQKAATLRDRGDYSGALAELSMARALDPQSETVQTEIEHTTSACLAEKSIGVAILRCD